MGRPDQGGCEESRPHNRFELAGVSASSGTRIAAAPTPISSSSPSNAGQSACAMPACDSTAWVIDPSLLVGTRSSTRRSLSDTG